MQDVTEVKGISENRVGTEVQQLVFAGATKVECEKQPDGRWTIRAS
jgi:hypothetical protein